MSISSEQKNDSTNRPEGQDKKMIPTEKSLSLTNTLPVVTNPIGWVLLWEDNYALITAQVFPTKRDAESASERDWKAHSLIACPLDSTALLAIRSDRSDLRERVQILGARIEDLISDRNKWKGLARGSSNG
jgi:hypothetical protein